MSTTKIEWATKVWNPITGCSHGCSYCYARRFAERMKHNGKAAIAEKYRNGFKPSFHAGALLEPSKWRKPQRVFVGSMGDLFDAGFTQTEIEMVFYRMIVYDHRHTFMLLTKQPANMLRVVKSVLEKIESPSLPSNIYVGVSITNQDEANTLIPILLRVPALIRFVSVEPMLGPVDLNRLDKGLSAFPGRYRYSSNHLQKLPAINWVICGGETGHGAMPIHPDWVRSLRDQCAFAKIPFFFKNWGAYKPAFYDVNSASPCKNGKNWTTYWKNGKATKTKFQIIDTDGEFVVAGIPEGACSIMRNNDKDNKLDGMVYNQIPELK